MTPNPSLKPEKQSAAIPTVSAVLDDGSIVETLFRPAERQTLFARWKDGVCSYVPFLDASSERLVPYSPRNNLLKHEVVLLPSGIQEYGTEAELLGDIRGFIHRYVDVTPLFEEIATYYVLLTWIYDAFNELPYLRVRGDFGSGKTRFLLTVGSLCCKPIFAGASTVSPLFRILDAFRGTLVIDEGDFRMSDEKAEIVKILNNGNARGFPVLRSEAVGRKEFDPRAYAVFGPKLVATRGFFEDRALESRCITEDMGQSRLRDDIPINLDETHREDARNLRNKLLLFRFRNLNKARKPETAIDRSIEPRLNQIFAPLLAVIEDPEAQEHLRSLLHRYNRELLSERGMEIEAQVLDVIRDALASSSDGKVSIKEITNWFVDRHGEDYERKVTPKWIGSIIRKRLRLQPERSHGVFVIPQAEVPKLKRLYEKYGLGQEEPANEPPSEATPPGLFTPPGDLGDLG